jgi:quinol monooxygenase YgiN
MVTKALLIRLEIKPGKDEEAEQFLQSALPLVRLESATTAWFGIRFGRSEYGIFDAFPDEAGREAHLSGAVAKALAEKSDELFTEPPRIQKIDVLANKLPPAAPAEPTTKALLLTFKAKDGNEPEVEQFLRGAQPLVMEEPDTTAWFAIHLENGDYGIFDVFPDNNGRFKHLIGHVPREIVKHSLTILGSVPEMEFPGVLAEKLGE